MKKLLSAFLFWILLSVTAWAGPVEDAVAAFDKNPTEAHAAAFFALLQQEEYTDEPVVFAPGTPMEEISAHVWYWAGDWYYNLQDYPNAVKYAEKSLPVIPEGDDAELLKADCLNLLAMGYVRLSDFAKAADYARQCYVLDEKSGDADRISSSLNTIAGIYMAGDQPEEGEKYILRALEYAAKADNPPRMAVLHGMASEIFHAEGKDEEALKYADMAFEEEKALGREYQAAVRLTQKASALIGLNRWDEAEALLEKVIPYFKAVGDVHSQGIADNKMGMTVMALKRYDDAIPYYREAADIFAAIQDPYNEIQARRGLYECLWRTDRKKEANDEFYRYNDLRDSLYKVASAESLAKYDAEFGNDWLRLENHAERQARIRITLIALAVALLAVLVWWLMHRRNRRQAKINDELNENIRDLREKYSQLHIHYDTAMLTNKAPQDEAVDMPQAHREFLEQTVDIINELFSKESVSVETISQRMNMSPYQFRQRLQSITGETPQSFIQTVRMRRARYLLDNHPELNISEVSRLCAYGDVPSFTRAFKNAFGMTPSKYLGR